MFKCISINKEILQSNIKKLIKRIKKKSSRQTLKKLFFYQIKKFKNTV